jgi:hypothetical protein
VMLSLEYLFGEGRNVRFSKQDSLFRRNRVS